MQSKPCEIIWTLNKFGQGVSYSQLEENHTALCLQKLATGLNHRVALPASIKPYVFTNLAWNNIDRLEETLTGKGTSSMDRIFPELKFHMSKRRSRDQSALSTKSWKSMLLVHVWGRSLSQLERSMFRKLKKQLKLPAGRTWCGLFQGKHIKIIRQSQAGLGLISERGTKCQSQKMLLGNCLQSMHRPTINAPATELNTVFEILNQSERIRKELLLETIVVVMDQALFAKAAEIAWKKKKSSFINILLRMGTFHTICNDLSILGKRFWDAGLKDICIEAGIVAEESINGVHGKHYNRAARVTSTFMKP